jgi:hypothetical protein
MSSPVSKNFNLSRVMDWDANSYTCTVPHRPAFKAHTLL